MRFGAVVLLFVSRPESPQFFPGDAGLKPTFPCKCDYGQAQDAHLHSHRVGFILQVGQDVHNGNSGMASANQWIRAIGEFERYEEGAVKRDAKVSNER
jgi:hypothetical protein